MAKINCFNISAIIVHVSAASQNYVESTRNSQAVVLIELLAASLDSQMGPCEANERLSLGTSTTKLIWVERQHGSGICYGQYDYFLLHTRQTEIPSSTSSYPDLQ